MAGGSTVAKSNESKKRLGRGLDSLMGMARPAPLAQVAVEPDSKTGGQPKQDGGTRSWFEILASTGQASRRLDLQMVAVNRLTPNPKQPRRFEQALKSQELR